MYESHKSQTPPNPERRLPVHFPIYQRTYSWTQKECQQLWADILRAGSTDEIGVHFIGSVVHIDEGLGNLAVQAPKLVIDGRRANPCDRCQNGQVWPAP